ncbi:2'-5' RNA ligase family protein [Actinomyces culturomici]|uniref:2'-5' RNA ligase family protein n=1 Tax=Actinomyces culturomici TaxID=1926276 RepID=UPI000E205530|nr:2'-5' RNA ligase family protein [Actinomyces culturomici]
MFLPQRSPDQDWLGVVVAIPEPWVTQLTDLRLGLGDLQGSRVPAHITILPPTPFPKEERPEVIRHLREVAKHHRPFRITLAGSDSFRPVSQVAFLTLAEGGRECTSLADEVRTGPLDIEQRFPYHPHVTLAQDVDDPALDLALDVGAGFEATWMVPGFRLDRVDENGMYQTMALFDFEAASL